MLNYKSYGDLSHDIAANLHAIPPVDIVVGVPKSGMVPAIMIASLKNVRFYDLDTFLFAYSARSGVRKYLDGETPVTRVLIVDDSVNTGTEFKRVRKKLEHLPANFEFIFCAIYGLDPAKKAKEADIVLSFAPQPRIFQWNYRNHIIAEHALFDMDGVLCVDPTDDDNDDGDAYIEFMASAAPLIIPTKTISAIVTSRLEKYRAQTEDWLHTHGVKFNELIMMDLPSAAERRRLKAHAPFKAEVYKSRSEFLFIESNWKQAQEIARLADKPVLCTANDTFISGAAHLAALESANRTVAPGVVSLEVELQTKIQRLVDRVAVLDPYAAFWLNSSGIKYDPRRVAELTPFHKTRLTISSLSAEDRPRAESPPKSVDVKRILMISATFDIARGAGAAASSSRLRDALRDEGYDVHTLSLEDFPQRLDADMDQPSSGTKMAFWVNYAAPKHSRELFGRVREIDPDCIVLGAVDRGILSMFDIAELRYPIVWVSRDNWAHTGGCLFKLRPSEVAAAPEIYDDYLPSLTCEGYLTGCTACPALNDVAESGKTRTSFEIKRAVFSYRKDIVFAPISTWLADLMKDTPLTAANRVVPVGNPIDLSVVKKLRSKPKSIRASLGLGRKQKMVLLAAHSLGNPRKGLKLALEALAGDERFKDCVLVTIGQQHLNANAVPEGVTVRSLGFIDSEEEKVAIYNAVDATLVPALQESLSVVASDSICCGTPVVAFETSGLASFLKHKVTGYLAQPFDAADLAEGLHWVLHEADSEEMAQQCIAVAEENFSASRNVAALVDAIDEAIAGFDGLGPMPSELRTLEETMNLLSDDHAYRSTVIRNQAKQIREVHKLAGAPSEHLYNDLVQLREKLDWNRRKRLELEGRVDATSTEMADLKANLEWNRNKRQEIESQVEDRKALHQEHHQAMTTLLQRLEEKENLIAALAAEVQLLTRPPEPRPTKPQQDSGTRKFSAFKLLVGGKPG